MKKVIAVFLCLLTALSLSACSAKNKKEEAPEKAAETYVGDGMTATITALIYEKLGQMAEEEKCTVNLFSSDIAVKKKGDTEYTFTVKVPKTDESGKTETCKYKGTAILDGRIWKITEFK